MRPASESGANIFHFMPFSPDDTDGPKGLNVENLNFSLATQGWPRWCLVFVEEHPNIVGHTDLKGDSLIIGFHRCELGIGMKRNIVVKGSVNA